jgi:tRNA modification GTPase
MAAGADRATIFALASAPGAAGVAVWRVSGARAGAAFGALCNRPLPTPRTMARVRVCDPGTETVFDDGFAVWFPGPASFTGEDTLELHVHGGRAVSRAMAQALSAVDGVRPAIAGEFTRRAVEAGKLDLTQAEGIADLVAAETDAQHRQARRQLEGALGSLYDGWTQEILTILARFEAGMDFPDEDVPAEIFERTRPRLEALCRAMAAHLGDRHRGERIREGLRVAVTGAPNVGKSSLVNALARRDVAIVSHRPGTTRDVVEVALDLGGLAVIVADTAGLRETDDEIEAEGVRRARSWASSADIVLRVIDGPAWIEGGPTGVARGVTAATASVRPLIVVNKIDASPDARAVRPASPTMASAGESIGAAVESGVPAGARSEPSAPVVFLSARTGEGLPDLLDALRGLSDSLLGQTEAAAITRARHRQGVEAARESLSRALVQEDVELAGEDLRHALRALGGITGAVGVEDVLDVVFREFCIGK